MRGKARQRYSLDKEQSGEWFMVGIPNDTRHIWIERLVATCLVATVYSIQSNIGDQQYFCLLVVQLRPVRQHGLDIVFDLKLVNSCNGVRFGHVQSVSAIDIRAAKSVAAIAVFCLDRHRPECEHSFRCVGAVHGIIDRSVTFGFVTGCVVRCFVKFDNGSARARDGFQHLFHH